MKSECPICSSAMAFYVEHKQFGRCKQCPTCRLVLKAEDLWISREAELEIYNHHNNSIEDEGYVHFLNGFLEAAVLPFAGQGRRAFDFGSGPNPVLAQLLEREHGYQVDIYDLFYAPEASYKGKQYDLITSTEVFEHLADPIKSFNLLKSLLKEDGLLAIMTQFYPEDKDDFHDWYYIRDKSHISFYNPTCMAYMAKTQGLKLIYTDNDRYSSFKHR